MNVYEDLDQHYDFKHYDKRQHVSLIRGFFENANLKMCLSLPVKYFTDRSKAVLLLWIFYVFALCCVCYVFVRVCLCVLCGHLLGKGLPLGSRLWCLL